MTFSYDTLNFRGGKEMTTALIFFGGCVVGTCMGVLIMALLMAARDERKANPVQESDKTDRFTLAIH